ncbi:unnamed protein product [Ectocarpus sp. 13 AM-2016]
MDCGDFVHAGCHNDGCNPVVQLRFPGVLPVEPLKVDYTIARDIAELEEDFAELMQGIEDWEGCASHACPAFYHAEEKKTLQLGTSPQSLLVLINRNVTGSKITRDVTFPLDDLELLTSEADGTPTTTHYMAVAVMQHWGPYCTSGHNVTLVRKDLKAGSEWWLCNDEDVLSVSSACVTRNAVAVLYRRVPDS